VKPDEFFFTEEKTENGCWVTDCVAAILLMGDAISCQQSSSFRQNNS